MKENRPRRRDEGVSAILGTILVLALMMTLVPGLILLRSAISDEMAAQREAAERAAWCARHPRAGWDVCPTYGPMEEYDCTRLEGGAWLCLPPQDGQEVDPAGDAGMVLPTPTPPSAAPGLQ